MSVSFDRESLLALLKNRPALALDVLRLALGLDLSAAHAVIRIDSAILLTLEPASGRVRDSLWSPCRGSRWPSPASKPPSRTSDPRC